MSIVPLGEARFSLSCQKCGSNGLTIPDEATDDSPVTCSGCGAEIARWGDVKVAVTEAAAQKFKQSLADTFGKNFKNS